MTETIPVEPEDNDLDLTRNDPYPDDSRKKVIQDDEAKAGGK